jgi:arsenate reductase
MDISIYHNPRCSKSRQTLQLLQNNGITPKVIEYLKNAPSSSEITHIIKNLPQPAGALVRNKDAADLGIDYKNIKENDIISLLTKHPEIMERPIVVSPKGVRIGRPPESVLEIL